MDGEPPFLADPDGTREEIMRATFRALCEHGYADLTIQRIGEQFPKSKSLLYHHYDSKDELLLDFLSFMLTGFEESVPLESGEGPRACLESILDHALDPDLSPDRNSFEAAMFELSVQGAHDERYREQFTRNGRAFADRLATVIAAGIEDGTFREVDPERVAQFLVAVLDGARHHRATADLDDAAAVRAELDAYLTAVLYASDG